MQEFTVSVWGQPDPHVNAPYRWILTLAFLPIPIFTGWVLAKLHQGQRGAVIAICCLVVTALQLPRLVSLTTMTLHEPGRSMNVYLHLAMMVVLITGLLLGALVAGSQERPTTVTE